MPKIGILEDRPNLRTTIRRSIQGALPQSWETVDVPLLPDPKAFPAWLVDNDVQVLLADYLLNEQNAENDQPPVAYTSDTVITAIRQTMPDFPVYIVTAVPEGSADQPLPGDAEAILTRVEFTKNPAVYVKRMVRAATRFSKQFQRELADLAILSEKIAQGTATNEDRRRAKALQALIGLDLSIDVATNRQQALDELGAKLQRLETLKAELEHDIHK